MGPLLQVRDGLEGFGRLQVLKGVGLTVGGGEAVAAVGENGRAVIESESRATRPALMLKNDTFPACW